MATNSNWTVVMDDKIIINHSVKNSNNFSTAYTINDDSFWNDSKWSNIWAIQYIDDNLDYNDTVEYRDETPHATWNNAGLGDFSQFTSKWDAAHLVQLQSNWDNIPGYAATGVLYADEAEKISDLGPRPTSYSS